MTWFLFFVGLYCCSAVVAAYLCAIEAMHDGVLHTGELVAGLFLTFCPLVNTGLVGLAAVGYIDGWLEARGLNRVVWRSANSHVR